MSLQLHYQTIATLRQCQYCFIRITAIKGNICFGKGDMVPLIFSIQLRSSHGTTHPWTFNVF